MASALELNPESATRGASGPKVAIIPRGDPVFTEEGNVIWRIVSVVMLVKQFAGFGPSAFPRSKDRGPIEATSLLQTAIQLALTALKAK